MAYEGPATSRADARRNRALVLQAARSAFEERGLAAPLGEIARRAGVGAGTVHRHFPSKEGLFRASVADRLRLFADTAADLAETEDPGGVFFRFLASVVRLSARNKALCDALEAVGAVGAVGAGRSGAAVPAGPEGEFLAALHVLLLRAQEAGAVREDVDLADAHALLVGCMSMERQRAQEGRSTAASGRMTALMCDALRADHATGAPAAKRAPGRRSGGAAASEGAAGSRTARTGSVTKPSPEVSVDRNETRCAVCAEPVSGARTGRPARYCGGACRQRAHRARTRAREQRRPGV